MASRKVKPKPTIFLGSPTATAAELLAQMRPFDEWKDAENPSPEVIEIRRWIICELQKLAAVEKLIAEMPIMTGPITTLH